MAPHHHNVTQENITTADSTYVPIMSAGEPMVGWRNATIMWGPVWQAYIYTAIIINSFLLLWSIINIILIYRMNIVLSRSYFLTINLMVIVFSLSRLLFYSIDPYSIREIMPKLASTLLFNLTFPTLTVGFYVLYVALKQCTIPNTQLSPLILKSKCIAIFVCICFTVSISTDLIVYFVHSFALMVVLCQLYYIVWGIAFFGLFVSVLLDYRAHVRKTKNKMNRSCYKVGHCRRDFDKRNLKTLPAVLQISCVSSVLLALIVISTIYMVITEFTLLKRKAMDSSALITMCDKYRQLWPFFTFKCIQFILIQLMALTLVICGTQPSKRMRVIRISASTRITSSTLVSVTRPSSTTQHTTSTEHQIEQEDGIREVSSSSV